MQPLSHNCPSDNREELFKPGTIVAVVAVGDIVLSSGREPCVFAFHLPASSIFIIGPVVLTIFSKQF